MVPPYATKTGVQEGSQCKRGCSSTYCIPLHGLIPLNIRFNTRSGYGFCHVCGTLLLKDVCAALNIRPSDYGGISRKEVMPNPQTHLSNHILVR
jgi:hypothetical protein